MVQLLIAPYTFTPSPPVVFLEPTSPPPPSQSLEWMLQMQTAPFETAAVFLEPILGEGGFLSPPPGFMRALRTLCDKHGILVIADEVWGSVGIRGEVWGSGSRSRGRAASTHLRPAGFMRALHALCDKHGILIIADEVWGSVGKYGEDDVHTA